MFASDHPLTHTPIPCACHSSSWHDNTWTPLTLGLTPFAGTQSPIYTYTGRVKGPSSKKISGNWVKWEERTHCVHQVWVRATHISTVYRLLFLFLSHVCLSWSLPVPTFGFSIGHPTVNLVQPSNLVSIHPTTLCDPMYPTTLAVTLPVWKMFLQCPMLRLLCNSTGRHQVRGSCL